MYKSICVVLIVQVKIEVKKVKKLLVFVQFQ